MSRARSGPFCPGPSVHWNWPWVAAAIAATLPAQAHVLSMSQGSLRVEGTSVHYELRMPLLEAPRDRNRESLLLGAFQVTAAGRPGAQADARCREVTREGLYVCDASYQFEEAPAKVRVRCDFPSVTVPQHVHILRSGEGAAARQTVFDITVREADIRFVPPTRFEVIGTEAGAGVRRTITSPELLLFLIGLAFAGRSVREFLSCAGAFLLAQALLAVGGQAIGWELPVAFLETAAALTVAYLASEVLFLPDAAKRWLVCGAMGCIHGLFLGAYLGASGMNPAIFLPGALATEALLGAGIAWIRLRFASKRSEQLAGLLLLVAGLGWFGLRILG